MPFLCIPLLNIVFGIFLRYFLTHLPEMVLKKNRYIQIFFKWTHLEALLKCDGGGFCSVSNKSDILKKTEVISYAFELKNKSFAVSLVKEI